MSAHPFLVEALAAAALRRSPGQQRNDFLRQACGGDNNLCQQVERAVIEADIAIRLNLSRGTTHESASTVQAAPHSPQDGRGARIGPYKLLQPLGEGGMGEVWMAEQSEPVRRLVALKIIKRGMDSSNVLARFEVERQALALMDHPNIARVFDAGEVDSGRPYFVMELVKGLPITHYCDDKRLSIRERLDLFVPVCQAIQHAHQKGIIHRDIKPSNVLVAEYDGKPVPKVIDFGIAKAMGQQLSQRTLVTEFGAMIGTLEYMSPEQAELNQLDIDTRSDVYSLGVLLYQLLTGTTPITKDTVQKIALDELLRCIREQEPPKPSTRLHDLLTTEAMLVAKQQKRDSASAAADNAGSELGLISSRRKMDPLRLAKSLRGDLDWIAMKALEKDRNRRYDTANGLGMDLLRHLQDEPVLARPPTAAYRFKKFVRKNRLAVGAAICIVLLLALATGISTGLALWANHEKVRAVKAEAKAKERADDADAVLNFFNYHVFAAAQVQGSQPAALGRDVTVKRAIQAAEPRVAALFTNRPNVELRIRAALGSTLLNLGEYTNAVAQLEPALALAKQWRGADDSLTLIIMEQLASAYYKLTRWSEMMALLEDNLRISEAKFGREHVLTIRAASHLGSMYGEFGRTQDDIKLQERAVKFFSAHYGTNDDETLHAMIALSAAYRRGKQFANAISLGEVTRHASLTALGPTNSITIWGTRELGESYMAAGRPKEAVRLYQAAFQDFKIQFGPNHYETWLTLNLLAVALMQDKQPQEAVPLFEALLRDSIAGEGPRRLAIYDLKLGLAEAYVAAGKLAEAEVFLRKELAHLDPALIGHTLMFQLQMLLGNALAGQKRFSDAEKEIVEGAEGLLRRYKEHPDRAHRAALPDAGERIVAFYEAWDKHDKAEEWRLKFRELNVLEQN